MIEPRPLIGVSDVTASRLWYETLLGCRSDHGGTTYERLLDGDRLVLQLHAWDDPEDHHEYLGTPDRPFGNGVLLWFLVDDFPGAVKRARGMEADVLEELYNERGMQHECWIRDPDGYVVVLAGPSSWKG